VTDGADHPAPAAAPAEADEAALLPRPAPGAARNAVLKLAVLVVVVGGGFLLLRYTPLAEHVTREALLALLERLRGAWWTPLVLLALYLVIAPLGIPVTPLVFAGGAIFGPLLGAFYNFLGAWLGALLSFVVGRGLGRDFVVHFVGKRLEPVERFLAHQGFWPLVRTRFLPLPFVMVNYGAALAGVPLGLFAASAAVGLLPSIVVFTYFWAAVASGSPWQEMTVKLLIALSLLMMLSLLPNLLRRLRRR
jgi:uncharacterized membrane protein YdjX (TVP38/TMEM64 family)